MADPKEPASLKERLEWEILKRGLAQAADSALDNLEHALFGKDGVPEESGVDALTRVREHMQMAKPDAAPAADPLEQTRAQLRALKEQLQRGEPLPAGPEVPAPPPPSPEDPLAKARAELEALKKARTTPPPPVKKTL
ncbi:MAG TPA: hypothetical protein PKY30_06345 [Myxococcota bacterium]|nr:hypothetical protein [Myxococcota bacterium]HNH46637.1 hypothetical protein [Myxococcota bacterium]